MKTCILFSLQLLNECMLCLSIESVVLSPKKYREQGFIWEVCGSCHFLVPGFEAKPLN